MGAIDPASCSYEEWLAVGQALHHEGYSADDWREWSRRDAARYNERDFETKWRGFGFESGAPVTGGTIVKMAFDRGWAPAPRGHALDWNDTIYADEKPIVDTAYIDGEKLEPVYAKGHGRDELIAYIDALFEPDEFVAYVTNYVEEEKDGYTKCVPADRGVYTRTAKDIRDALKGGIESGIGTTHDESGAWIRFNPMDGHGVGNANVTAYRHCLIESDVTEPETVKAVVEQLNLPVSVMVHSGGKSMHVIVKVDAKDSDEYRQRVERIYGVCEKNGIVVDKANKNPSRLSRMPGVTRRGERQYIASLKCGADDYDEWEEWYAAETDELPDPVSMSTLFEDGRPEMAEEIIAGVLRCGHKMLVSGPSKAGKSFILIALCIALSEGLSWLGFKCRQSKVLYVNLELDERSCMNRFADVYEALGIEPSHTCDLDVWNLRGRAEALNKLVPKMIRRGKKRGYDAIVIDPIYKVMTGDENSASDMAAFANCFDMLALEVGCSVIYCHHHSKGYQEGKRSIDRASGSGVFARDPDAILDMVELFAEESDIDRRINARLCAKVAKHMREQGLSGEYASSVSAARRAIADFALEGAIQVLDDAKNGSGGDLKADFEASKAVRPTAWRIEGTLREFAGFKPINLWFDWPLHVADSALSDAPEMGEVKSTATGGKRTSGEGNPRKKSRHEKINELISEAVEACADDGVKPTRKEVRARIGKLDGKAVSAAQVTKWTTPSKSSWSEWEVRDEGIESGAKVIVKKASEDDFDDVWE